MAGTMAQETELKLLLQPQELPRLRRHPLLAAQAPKRQRLLNTYMDTPDLALQAQRIAVRERRAGRRTLLTVKTAGQSSGGLSVRGEWEAPVHPGAPDFRALMKEHPLADRLCAMAGRLIPIFHTDFVRESWTLRHQGALIELALDRGRVHTGKEPHRRQVPLVELELELQSGPASALHSLAIDLALPPADGSAPGLWLMPSDLSKAQRGMALFEGTPPSASRPEPVNLTGVAHPLQAMCAVGWACLTPLQANLAQLVLNATSWQQPEFVHQSRVALRRLRTALRLFAPWLTPRFVRHWLNHWGTVAGTLGETRDWDVLTQTWLPRLLTRSPAQEAALRWAQERQQAASRQARDWLAQPAQGLALLAFARGLQTQAADGAAADVRLDRWARRTLADIHQGLRRQARQALHAGPDARHALRLTLKRERYALECLSSLMPTQEAAQATQALAQAQDVLGWLNDLATARDRLQQAPDTWRTEALARIDGLERRELRKLPGIEANLRDLVLFKR